ncbi:hypothetical protein CC86DRAFT_368877 [Ophiobolus disseminans]|uniref:Uncharacterized protein n=1 Tax=Ophiobolus disseminans TaxID=1469910 RepID=A0A6A7A7K1_9PLEO|nr:hypothetical protein CC86DRAFT_368877 [Ophiobolus disseminans]
MLPASFEVHWNCDDSQEEDLERFVVEFSALTSMSGLLRIRKSKIEYFNSTVCSEFHIGNTGAAGAVEKRATTSNVFYSKLVLQFEDLHELNLRFHTPTLRDTLLLPTSVSDIKTYLQGFEIGCLLRLDKFQTLKVAGSSSYHGRQSRLSRFNFSGERAPTNDVVDHLLPIRKINEEIVI